MAQIIISKIKFRRGTNAQRQYVVLDQGEPAVTTDTGRLYVGTGTLSGGIVVGNKIHQPLVNLYSLSSLIAEVNDLVVVNNKLYQLITPDYWNISAWADISTKVDSAFFNYDSNNFLTLNLSSIDASFIDPSTIGAGLKIDGGVLQLDFDTDTLEIVGNQVNIKPDGITEIEIISSVLSSGLIGGSGSKIQLDVDPTYFGFNGNSLTLLDSIIQFSELSASWFGDGIIYDLGNELISTVVQNVDNDTIELNAGTISVNPDIFGPGLPYNGITDTVSANVVDIDYVTLTKTLTSGIISLANLSATDTVEWPYITVDTYGRVTDVKSAVYDIFECDSTLSPANSSFGPLSALFNGNPTGIIQGGGNPNNITKFKVLSSDYVTVVELSSAGFLVFQGNYTTRGAFADTIPRFAIPIFRF